jgi:hypothetical protein
MRETAGSAAARPVLDKEWLAEPLREPLTPSGAYVDTAARSKADEDARQFSPPENDPGCVSTARP